MFEDDDELADLQKQQESANDKKAYLGVAGAVAQNLADAPLASEIFYKRKSSSPNMKGMFDAAAGAVENPMDREQKALAYLRAKREGVKQQRDMDMASASDDPESGDSKAYAEQLSGLFPKFAPYVQGKSKAQLQEMMPILMQKARGDEDRALRAQEMMMRSQDRKDALQTRLDEKAMKQKEMSAAQAKQRGLYDIGKKAEEQYAGATANPKEYDPTGVGQWIDNSDWAPNWLKNDKAVESQAAQDSWIESFLRDASGAAIAQSERGAYKKLFFPQPGDSKDVVNNKATLRAQKMESARAGAGMDLGHGPTETAVATRPAMSPQEMAAAELAKRKAKTQTAGR